MTKIALIAAGLLAVMHVAGQQEMNSQNDGMHDRSRSGSGSAGSLDPAARIVDA